MTAVVVDAVSHRYGRTSALREVSLTLLPGITGLLGPNGAGKTTLLGLVAGAGRLQRGRVTVGGRPVADRQARARIGSVLQSRPLNGSWRVRQIVEAVARLQGVASPGPATDRVLEQLGLSDVTGRRIGTLSLGQRQRVALALSLVHEPTVLLLDEPFTGIDPDGRAQLVELLRRHAALGGTVLLSSHVLPELDPVVGSVVVLVDGRLRAHGGVEAIRRAVLSGHQDVLVECDDARRLGASLAARDWVRAVRYGADAPADRRTPALRAAAEPDPNTSLVVTVTDLPALATAVMATAAAAQVRLWRIRPLETDLDGVFARLTEGS